MLHTIGALDTATMRDFDVRFLAVPDGAGQPSESEKTKRVLPLIGLHRRKS